MTNLYLYVAIHGIIINLILSQFYATDKVNNYNCMYIRRAKSFKVSEISA